MAPPRLALWLAQDAWTQDQWFSLLKPYGAMTMFQVSLAHELVVGLVAGTNRVVRVTRLWTRVVRHHARVNGAGGRRGRWHGDVPGGAVHPPAPERPNHRVQYALRRDGQQRYVPFLKDNGDEMHGLRANIL